MNLADMRGDIHMHTSETDGKATLREMAEAAAALGYEYIAITDHSKALAMSNGLDDDRVVAFARQVRQLNRRACHCMYSQAWNAIFSATEEWTSLKRHLLNSTW